MFKVVFSVLFLLDGVLASPITLRAAGAFFSPPLIAASALSPPETFQSVSRDLRSEETRQSAAPLPVTLSETLSSLTPVLNNVENILVSLTGSAGDLFSTFDSPPSQVQGALEILTSQFGTLTSGMNSAHVRLNEAHTPDFSSTQDFLTKIKTIVLRTTTLDKQLPDNTDVTSLRATFEALQSSLQTLVTKMSTSSAFSGQQMTRRSVGSVWTELDQLIDEDFTLRL